MISGGGYPSQWPVNPWPVNPCPEGMLYEPGRAARGEWACQPCPSGTVYDRASQTCIPGTCPSGMVFDSTTAAQGGWGCVAPNVCPQGSALDPRTQTCQTLPLGPGGGRSNNACSFGLPFRCSRAQWIDMGTMNPFAFW